MTRPINLSALNQRIRYNAQLASEEAREAQDRVREALAARIAADRAQRDAVIEERCFRKVMGTIGDAVASMTIAKAQRLLTVHVRPSPNDQGRKPLATNWPGSTIKYVQHGRM